MTVPPSLLRNLRPFNQAQIPLTSRFLFHSLKTPFFCKYFPCSFLLLLKLSIFIISYNSISCNIFSISHIFLRSDKQKSTFPSFFYLSHTQRTALQFLKPVPLPPPLKKINYSYSSLDSSGNPARERTRFLFFRLFSFEI